MALTNQMSKASYTRGNKVTIVKNPENCGSKKFKFGIDDESQRGAYPKVGASGKIAKRIYGGWYLVHMDSGHLVKMRPAAFRDSHRVNQVMEDWNEVSDHPPQGLDLLIRTAQTEHLGETNQVLEDKVKRLEAELAEKDTLLKLQEAVGECNEILKGDLDHAEKRYEQLKAWVDERESYVAELEERISGALKVEKENTQLAESLRRAAAIANAANARYHELFNDTQEMRSKNVAQEQELARLRGALMGIMQRMQPQACEVLECGCDCDDCCEDEGEDCLGCESGVDCPQAHTCGETNTSGQWEVVNNES
jgi:hypothetical protein